MGISPPRPGHTGSATRAAPEIAILEFLEDEAVGPRVVNAPGDSVCPDHEHHLSLMRNGLNTIETTRTGPAHCKPDSDDHGMVPAHVTGSVVEATGKGKSPTTASSVP
jgi:hypothetical protein